MVQKPQIFSEQFPVLLIDQNHFLTVVVGFFCQALFASRYENNNLRASETGDAEELPTRKTCTPVLALQWGRPLVRLTDRQLANSRTNLLSEKSSNQKSDSDRARSYVRFAFFRILTEFLSALSYNGGLVRKVRLAIGRIGPRNPKPDLDFGRSHYLFFQKMENNTNQSGAQSRNRSRNRNRNGGGNRSGGGQNRNNRPNGTYNGRDRSRDRVRKPKVVELTLVQKILKAITFGAIDPNKKKSVATNTAQSVDNQERKSTRSASSEAGREKSQKSSREPKVYDVTNARLYVGNLDYNAAESDLEDLFRGVGNVISTEVVTNARTQQSKGFAFIEMGSVEEARRAVEELHDKDFMGRKLLVSGAKSDGPRGDEA